MFYILIPHDIQNCMQKQRDCDGKQESGFVLTHRNITNSNTSTVVEVTGC